MPELPDVEGYRRSLAAVLPGRTVRHVRVYDAGVLHGTSATGLGRALHGRRFTAPRRHGKWLMLATDGPTLLVHSGMTGRPYYAADGADSERFDRIAVVLDRGEFRFTDLRKLRGIWLAHDEREIARVTGPLGPDALDVDLATFRSVLAGARGRLKTRLTNQAALAGLGNLLSDEICWQARVHPAAPLQGLSGDEVRTLHRVMRRVLRTSVRHGCVPDLRGWLTAARDPAEAPCPRCGTALRRGRLNGRATVWCPREQPGR